MGTAGLPWWLLLAALQLLLPPQGVPASRLWGSGIHRTRPVSEAADEADQPHNGTDLASVTAVIQVNSHVHISDDIVHTLHALHAVYSGVFGRVVFTGQGRPQGLHAHILWTDCNHFWTFFSLCLSYAMAEYPQPESGGGWLFIGDDVIFDPCRLAQLDPNKFWSPQLHLRPYTPGEVPDPGWRWWEWLTDGAEHNSSYGLDMALKELPWMYKERFKANMGPDWTDEQGNIKQVAHHRCMDFLYVPSGASADWIHLAHHFWHWGVMGEISMPNIVYFLAGHDGLEFPMGLNIIAMQDAPPHVRLPAGMEGNSSSLSDADAAEMLRIGEGIFLPLAWHDDGGGGGLEDWRNQTLTWWHAYKMQEVHRRQAFLEWWWALPCFNQPEA